MIAAFLAGVAAAVNQFKVPPLMQVLLAELKVDMVTGGWLMSIVSVSALLLAIPAAFLLMRLGLKVTGLLSAGCTLAGAVVGAMAPDATVLLLARMLEGVGLGLMTIVGPAAISAWFEPRERGLPMGIWAAWVPLGNVIMFNLANPLLDALGWRAIWWFGALLALLGMVIYGLVVSDPPRPGVPIPHAASRSPLSVAGSPSPAPVARFLRRLLNPASWILGLAFGTLTFSMLGYITWAPTFLTERLHIDAAAASSYASLVFLAGIPGNILAGMILDRAQDRYRLLAICFLASSFVFAPSFLLGSVAVVVPYMILLGFITAYIPTAVFTLAPETMDRPQFAGLGLAIAMLGSSMGTLIGPPLLGSVISDGNWILGSLCLVLVTAFGFGASLLA